MTTPINQWPFLFRYHLLLVYWKDNTYFILLLLLEELYCSSYCSLLGWTCLVKFRDSHSWALYTIDFWDSNGTIEFVRGSRGSHHRGSRLSISHGDLREQISTLLNLTIEQKKTKLAMVIPMTYEIKLQPWFIHISSLYIAHMTEFHIGFSSWWSSHNRISPPPNNNPRTGIFELSNC